MSPLAIVLLAAIVPGSDAPGDDVSVAVDLRDDWTPRIFSETPERPQAYRAVLVALASERPGAGKEWDTARRDRFYELYGISPSISVIRARLLDDARHACHAAVDGEPLRALKRTLGPWSTPAGAAARAAATAAIRAAQQHLGCEGFLPGGARPGELDAGTREALALYQRRHMIPARVALDAETRDALVTDSRELDFRALLRALRERVLDATGLIEDGSARNAWEPVLGRFIDAAEYRPPLRPRGLDAGAPDLVARATEAAATALGWTSPEAAGRALAGQSPGVVAVRLPAPPRYHAGPMRLRVEINRGDVWTSYPLDAQGRSRPSPVRNRPTLVLYAQTDAGEIPLVRWPTTIGAWQQEKLPDESVALRYKASPAGRRYWRDLLAAPAWFPPPTTPDRELVRRRPDGRWAANDDAVGPGYRSAYGLMALLHHRAVGAAASGGLLADAEIRTHGSASYRSILRGSSHGCHRLFNHLAIRLGSFLLAHHGFERHGLIQEAYVRRLSWKGHQLVLRAGVRGYRYELQPPITVDVLPGRSVRSGGAPSAPAPAAPVEPTPPQPSADSAPRAQVTKLPVRSPS